MSGILVVVAILVVMAIIVIAVAKKSPVKEDTKQDFPYIKRGPLFTPAERSFFGVLNQAVEGKSEIFGKVRVADVITTKKGLTASIRQKAFNKISSKHFDYILCNKEDLSVLCAIELNDSSHNSEKTKKRDAFLEGACDSANIPLVQIKAKATYNINDIKELLGKYLPDTDIEITTKESTEDIITMACPKCSSEIVEKVAKKGKNAGKKFLACSSFPKCRYVEEIRV